MQGRAVIGWLGGLLVLCAPAKAGFVQAEVTLHVTVVDFDNASGAAGVAVWSAARGFPEDIEHAVATTYAGIEDGTAVAQFSHLAPGTYAVTVYHDENNNGRFDKNWIGMPTEAWGVSNNVHPRLRAPRFDEARLDLKSGEHSIEIRVR